MDVIVGGVLSLNETVKLGVLRCLLAEDGVAVGGRVGRKVGGRVLLRLAILDGKGDHVLLGRVVELLGSIYTNAS